MEIFSTVWQKLKTAIPFTAQSVVSATAISGATAGVKAASAAKTTVTSLGSSITGVVEDVSSGLKWGLILLAAIVAIFIIAEIKRARG